jgi:hypothetical protein
MKIKRTPVLFGAVLAMGLIAGCGEQKPLEVATITVKDGKLAYEFDNVAPEHVSQLEPATGSQALWRILLSDDEWVDLLENRDDGELLIEAELDEGRVLRFRFEPSNREHGFFYEEGDPGDAVDGRAWECGEGNFGFGEMALDQGEVSSDFVEVGRLWAAGADERAARPYRKAALTERHLA